MGLTPTATAPRLLDGVRATARTRHYSLSTEKQYVYWIQWYVRFNGLRHPREMGAAEVSAFMTWLADERQVSPSTHRQALSALLFLYLDVLKVDLPWLAEIGRPRERKRVPVVLSKQEVAKLLDHVEGNIWRLLARLLYGTGMRLNAGTPGPGLHGPGSGCSRRPISGGECFGATGVTRTRRMMRNAAAIRPAAAPRQSDTDPLALLLPHHRPTDRKLPLDKRYNAPARFLAQ